MLFHWLIRNEQSNTRWAPSPIISGVSLLVSGRINHFGRFCGGDIPIRGPNELPSRRTLNKNICWTLLNISPWPSPSINSRVVRFFVGSLVMFLRNLWTRVPLTAPSFASSCTWIADDLHHAPASKIYGPLPWVDPAPGKRPWLWRGPLTRSPMVMKTTGLDPMDLSWDDPPSRSISIFTPRVGWLTNPLP